jgi:hypothetical protein
MQIPELRKDNLKKTLKESGYSDGAAEKISKWYD